MLREHKLRLCMPLTCANGGKTYSVLRYNASKTINNIQVGTRSINTKNNALTSYLLICLLDFST